MHPAPSIIFFTTLSGAGYGLLAWIGVVAPLIEPAPPLWLRVVALALAFGLIVGGLLCSTLHLQHPQRAWRAFSQWRSSWLSREGVMALVTFVPAGLFAIGWGLLGETGGLWTVLGVLSAAASLVTVACTAMIYASLKPVRQWRHPLVLPVYLLFALATGSAWGAVLLAAGDAPLAGLLDAALPVTIVLLVAAWAAKAAVWAGVMEGSQPMPTAASATGLGGMEVGGKALADGGQVRELMAPHTEENWLLKEMAYRIGRKHAHRLRIIAAVAGVAVPVLLLAVALAVPGVFALFLTLAAAAGAQLGVTVERWLFFAEATHTVTLYYGAETA